MPARARSVSFEAQPVYSRLPHDDESHVMKAFSRHTTRCKQCSNPYDVHLKGETLCDKGHQRALDVAQYVYTRNGQAYSLVDREGHQRVQIEIPAGCEPVRLLLRAMDRGLRLMRTSQGASAAPVSCDRTYYVAPRRTTSEKKTSSSPSRSAERSTSTRSSSGSKKSHHKSSSSTSSTSSTSSSASSSSSNTSASSASSKQSRRPRARTTVDAHAQAWPRGGAVYYAPRTTTYEPRAAAPVSPYYPHGYPHGYYSFPAYEPPRSGLISVW